MVINGVSVEVNKCAHDGCHAEPSEEDLRRAVAKAQRIRECPQWRCAYCGEPIKAKSYRVYHDTHGWSALETEIEPAVSLRIQPQNDREILEHNGLHLRCVEKALPFVNGLAQRR